jgi:DNA replication protein DnaC
MSENNTLQQLKELKLKGMYQAFSEHLEQLLHQDLSFNERFALLVDREWLSRKNRRITASIQKAKLRQSASLEAVDYTHSRHLNKSHLAELASCDFIHHHRNLLITGATGTGKSFIACAIGHQACQFGFSVRYIPLTRFLEELSIAQADGSYAKQLNSLLKVDLLILDDFGLPPALKAQQSRTLFNLIDDRHQRKSTLITSQLPIAHWHDFIGEANFADAILDRLLQHVHKIEFKGGESMRKSKIVD